MSEKINCWSWIVTGVMLATVQAVSAQEGGQAPQTLDAEYAQMTERVPGFGGLYLDEKGTTHVYLKDTAHARAAQGLGKSVQVQQGEYDFRELFAWKEKLRSRLAQPGAVFLDIDEQRNRLVFGVQRDFLKAFSTEFKSFSREAQVPPEAVIIEAAEPVVFLEKLNDTIRPVPGGVLILRLGPGGEAHSCTLGFNAVREGVRGFVTNSHCTATRGSVEGTVFFQIGQRIGVETVDPPDFLFGSCPSGRSCSFADAAFVAYDSEALSARGQIANASCGNVFPLLRPLEIPPALPRRPVLSPSAVPVPAGSIVAKTGASSGCTFGIQTHTCIDTNVTGSSVLMLCQNRVLAFSEDGDSGAPVYVFQDNNTGVLLAGILWGRIGDTFYYSPWLNVHIKLGGLLVYE